MSTRLSSLLLRWLQNSDARLTVNAQPFFPCFCLLSRVRVPVYPLLYMNATSLIKQRQNHPSQYICILPPFHRADLWTFDVSRRSPPGPQLFPAPSPWTNGWTVGLHTYWYTRPVHYTRPAVGPPWPGRITVPRRVQLIVPGALSCATFHLPRVNVLQGCPHHDVLTHFDIASGGPGPPLTRPGRCPLAH